MLGGPRLPWTRSQQTIFQNENLARREWLNKGPSVRIKACCRSVERLGKQAHPNVFTCAQQPAHPSACLQQAVKTHSAKLYRVVNVQKWEVSSWGTHQPRLTRLDFPSKGSQGRLELTDTSRALQSPFICRGGRWEWSRSHQHPSVSLPNATGKRQT